MKELQSFKTLNKSDLLQINGGSTIDDVVETLRDYLSELFGGAKKKKTIGF